MTNLSGSEYPTMSRGTWWYLRKRFSKAMPLQVTEQYLISTLSSTVDSAAPNTLPDLRQLLLIDERGIPTQLAQQWCDDAQYRDACKVIRERIYPAPIRDLGADATAVALWFATSTGVEDVSASRMAEVYLMLLEADPGTLAPTAQSWVHDTSVSVNDLSAVSKPTLTKCYAPVFKPRKRLACLIQAIKAALALPLLYFVWIILFGNRGIFCMIQRLLFRVKYCRTGNTDPSIDLLPDAYTLRVRDFRALYGKDAAWEQWMEDNRDRYLPVFDAASAAPKPLPLGFQYDSAPIAYNPPWTSETEHLAALETMMELAFAGYDFQIIFGAAPGTTYGTIIAGLPTNSSHASGRTVFLYYETILNHEFAHVLVVPHHYDSIETIADGLHMPPGETQCLMDRNSSQFCSACRTALGIPLNVDNAAALAVASNEIHHRYPY